MITHQVRWLQRFVLRHAVILLATLSSMLLCQCERILPLMPPPPPPADLKPFAGAFRSGSGTAKYELSFEQQELRIYTMIADRMRLQTHITGFEEITGVRGHPQAVELTGRDRQAGAMPTTTIRIARQPQGQFELTRMKPLGGRVGLFERVSP